MRRAYADPLSSVCPLSEQQADHIAQVNQRAASTLRLCEELGVTPDEFTLSVSTPHFVLSEIRDASSSLPSASLSGSTSSVSSLPAHAAFTFSSLLSCLDKRLERLLQHKQHQQAQADRQLQLITALWARLDVPQQQQQSFLQSTARQPLSEQSMRLYAEEAARLERLKAERMGGLVEAVRREIAELWQRLHFTQAQRLLFRPQWLQPAVYDDALLALHEAERDRLQSVYAEWKPLLQLVEKRAEYRQQLSEHEISSADPDRLVSRQRTAYLLLKEEEKMRNMAGKWLPKLEAQLLERLERWEAEHGAALHAGRPALQRAHPAGDGRLAAQRAAEERGGGAGEAQQDHGAPVHAREEDGQPQARPTCRCLQARASAPGRPSRRSALLLRLRLWA